MKLLGLNFEIDDGYYRFFGKTAMSVNDKTWLQCGTDGILRPVETKNIIGGIKTCLDIDRRNGVIHRLYLIEMIPEFTLLMLQTGELLPEHFQDATEDYDCIHLPSVRFDKVETAVAISPRYSVAMRTVDVAGTAL